MWVAGNIDPDASMLENFPISSDSNGFLQMSIDAFNALDHQQFAGPSDSSATSGTSSFISRMTGKDILRQVQIGGRFIFRDRQLPPSRTMEPLPFRMVRFD
jgi:hypothetical protein